MKFIITGVGEKCFALYDIKNKGTAMATAYTIKQLMEAGHQVIGVKTVKPFSVICHCKNGEVAKKQPVRATGIPDTKRSMATFVKGIKPSRADIKANKEAARKRKATIKQKKAEEKAKAEAEAKKWMNYKKSHLQVIESAHFEESGEYHSTAYHDEYYLHAASPTAFALLKKILKNSTIRNRSYGDMQESLKKISAEFKRYGRVTVMGIFKNLNINPNDTKKIQFGYSPEYRIEASNDYADIYVSVVAYSYNGYRPDSMHGCHHCSLKDAWFGPVTDPTTVSDFFRRVSSTQKICVGTNYCGDRRMFDPRDYDAISI